MSVLTVGFKSNLNNNAERYKEKYLFLIKEMNRNYRCVKFVNRSMSSLGVFSDECSKFSDMMNDIGIDMQKAATLYNQKNDKYSHKSNILHLLL